jgi:voltage-gated potassium channel
VSDTAPPDGRDQPEPDQREQDPADRLARRLDLPMSVLGIVFLLVVLAEPAAQTAALRQAVRVAGWAIWVIFIAEFVVRAWVAGDRRRFWRRNWWQVLLLVLPFLRFVRLLGLFRFAGLGRTVSSAVRGSRSAGLLLSSRIAWVAAVTVVVILASSHLLYLSRIFPTYGEALHRSALAAVSGEPMGTNRVLAQVLEVALAAYSVIVFAALAGSLGAYFLGRHQGGTDAS